VLPVGLLMKGLRRNDFAQRFNSWSPKNAFVFLPFCLRKKTVLDLTIFVEYCTLKFIDYAHKNG
jgi:hypothetical protein